MSKRPPSPRSLRIPRAPGDIKSNGDRQGEWTAWTTVELKWLKDNYDFYCYTKDMCDGLPRHSYDSIVKMSRQLKLKRTVQGRTRTMVPRDIWWAIQKRPMTARQIQESLGVGNSSVYHALAAFRQAGVIHVDHWHKNELDAPWSAVWCVGEGSNVRRPKPNGDTRTMYDSALNKMKGNPFASMLLEVARKEECHADAEHKENVCT